MNRGANGCSRDIKISVRSEPDGNFGIGDPNEFAEHALWLLLLTGVRRSEILTAKWSDVDWDNGTLYIGETKNGEPVLTPLSQAAIARLNMIPKSDDSPYIICGDIPRANGRRGGRPRKRSSTEVV